MKWKLVLIIILLVDVQCVRRKERESSQFEANVDKINSLHSDPAFDILEEIQEHPLGAKIIQTIALQLKGGESLASISKLLNDLKSDLEGKQIQSDGQHTSFQSQCKTDLENYGQRIQLAVNEINDSEFKIGRLEGDMEDFASELGIKAGQIDTFQKKEASIRDLRLRQSANFSSRTSQLKEMIQAFLVVLPKLHEFYEQSVQKGNSFIEEEALASSLVELGKVGGDNPIISLVALTTSLDPTAIQTVIEKMEGIRDSLIASVQQEEELEAKAKRDSDVTLNEIFNAVQILTREKSSDEEALAETTRNRDIQAKRSSDANAEFEAAKAGLKQRRNQCQELQVQYQQNTIERSKEIDIIKQVQNIIATKINVMTAFIEENKQ